MAIELTEAWRQSKPCVFVGATVVHEARSGQYRGFTRCGLSFDVLWPGVYSVDGFRHAPPHIVGRPECARCPDCFAPWEDERHRGPDALVYQAARRRDTWREEERRGWSDAQREEACLAMRAWSSLCASLRTRRMNGRRGRAEGSVYEARGPPEIEGSRQSAEGRDERGGRQTVDLKVEG